MMKNVILYFGILLCFTSIASKGAYGQKNEETPKKEKIRVLIVAPEGRPDYYNWSGTAPLLKGMFEETKQIEARIVEDGEILATDIVNDYDVLLLHFKNHRPLKRNEQAKKQLMDFVRRGGGLFIFHFACGAFEDWPEYELLAGRVWNPKGPQHDPYGNFKLEYVDRKHPITQGLEDFDTTDELYTCLKDSSVPIHVLAESVSKVDGKRYPMAFVLERGQGRIFHTTLGHDAKSITAPGFQTLASRAVFWLGKRDIEP